MLGVLVKQITCPRWLLERQVWSCVWMVQQEVLVLPLIGKALFQAEKCLGLPLVESGYTMGTEGAAL